MPETPNIQVQMIWPARLRASLPKAEVPLGYILRPYHSDDKSAFFHLMALAGWPGWDEKKLHPWLYRILPNGWWIAVHEDSGQLAATSMATHDPTWRQPFAGEVGWTAAAPEHRGLGLGSLVVSAVVGRFIEAGYSIIHLYTEVWRLSALKMYLKLGFVPFLDAQEAHTRWALICDQLVWPYTPDQWARDNQDTLSEME